MANRVAWITAHREERSTRFAPRQGVDIDVRAQRPAARPGGWLPLDLEAIRTAARSPARRVVPTDRGRGRTRAARVP